MPTKKAAFKALRQAKKKTQLNKSIKTGVKKKIKETSKKILDKKIDEAKTSLVSAIKLIDKSAKQGIIKKNTAARKKSSLTKKLNQITKEGKK